MMVSAWLNARLSRIAVPNTDFLIELEVIGLASGRFFGGCHDIPHA